MVITDYEASLQNLSWFALYIAHDEVMKDHKLKQGWGL